MNPFFAVPPVIQLAADIDPQILELQLQAQGNVAEAVAIPSTSESTATDQVPTTKRILLSKKGKRDAEFMSSARTSGAARGDGSNATYPGYLFEPVPKQLKVEDLRRRLLVEQIKYTKNCNTLIDKLLTVVGLVKTFLSNMPKLTASANIKSDHPYQCCDDTEVEEVQEIHV